MPSTPRADGAQLMASFTTTHDGGGACCAGCGYPIPADAYHECWRLIENGERVTETKTIWPASLSPNPPETFNVCTR